MTRRPATITQADISRAIRAAKQAGANAVEVVQSNGTTIRVILNAPPVVPADEFEAWERDHEQAKAARRRDR
jgi:hypothetical protein